MKTVLVVIGHCCLLIGFIGVFLPILPTTPFVLIALWCYERGSPRFHALVLENRYVGPYITEWKMYRVIPLRAKVLAVGTILFGFGWSLYRVPSLPLKVVLTCIAFIVVTYILSHPSKRP